ncbi:hypothetical protein DFH06DRAFT_1134419 [Mycena polygramma]|nr:hypothetical protein DFH06DRAFT_1134419 [Mycena polygramma]
MLDVEVKRRRCGPSAAGSVHSVLKDWIKFSTGEALENGECLTQHKPNYSSHGTVYERENFTRWDVASGPPRLSWRKDEKKWEKCLSTTQPRIERVPSPYVQVAIGNGDADHPPLGLYTPWL